MHSHITTSACQRFQDGQSYACVQKPRCGRGVCARPVKSPPPPPIGIWPQAITSAAIEQQGHLRTTGGSGHERGLSGKHPGVLDASWRRQEAETPPVRVPSIQQTAQRLGRGAPRRRRNASTPKIVQSGVGVHMPRQGERHVSTRSGRIAARGDELVIHSLSCT
jgi:hypothetical protein